MDPPRFAVMFLLYTPPARRQDAGSAKITHNMVRLLPAYDRQSPDIIAQHLVNRIAQQLIGVRYDNRAPAHLDDFHITISAKGTYDVTACDYAEKTIGLVDNLPPALCRICSV